MKRKRILATEKETTYDLADQIITLKNRTVFSCSLARLTQQKEKIKQNLTLRACI